jgi:hypothetical protein
VSDASTYEDIVKTAQAFPDTPRMPDSQDEWELELAACAGANSAEVPAWARELISDLWREVCHRERWYYEPQSKATPISDVDEAQG